MTLATVRVKHQAKQVLLLRKERVLIPIPEENFHSSYKEQTEEHAVDDCILALWYEVR